jgi:predicted dehydrogenase
MRGIIRRVLEADSTNRIMVSAAYDPSAGSHAALRENLGYDYRVAESEEAVANDPELDWVFIGSWNKDHARQAILALDAGKNVFCEKPLAISLEECLAIREAAKRSGKIFSFGLVLRYSNHYQMIVEKLRSGAIGRIVSFEFNETLAFNHGGYIFGNWRRFRENAGTHLLEKCCHDIDLANWIINSLPVQAASFGGRDFFTPANESHVDRIGPDKTGAVAYRSLPDPDNVNPFRGEADIFDNQVAILQYANGVRGTFHTNCNTAISERRFYICGTEGTLRADLLTGTLELQRIGWDTVVEKFDTNASDGHGGGDSIMASALVRTLLNGEAPLASVDEGIYSAVAAFGIDAAADNRCVTDLMPMWKQAGIDPATVTLR